MQFAPESQILILNAVILGVAYFGVLPNLQHKTVQRIMTVDLVISTLAITVAGALFWGSGVQFNMLFFYSNWAVFAIVTLILMEIPLFMMFARKHGINLTGKD